MPDPAAPQDYDDLIRLIHERHDQMSRTFQRISVFLTRNPNEVAVRPVTAIAGRCDIHASSFVRFAQSLGYQGFKELQLVFRSRLALAAPGFEARDTALSAGLSTPGNRGELGLLADMVLRDIAALQELLNNISQQALAETTRLLQAADTIFLFGQMLSRPVAELMRCQLVMTGKRCVMLGQSGGLSAYIASSMTSRDLLMAISLRSTAAELLPILGEAEARGTPVVAIADSTLSPLAKAAKVLFAVPGHEGSLSAALAAPLCLAQALSLGLAARAGQSAAAPQIPGITTIRAAPRTGPGPGPGY
ncbi:MurR/RpiR family transcriptional regulator [Pseudogemmobacter faecipullorum]|uniref:MurR/RpiR family transcriptional regulator n=1 Tax=Pseudogemmobacter faecipullorum TaxID=2755041 RepID=A0ABS8CMV6_9RHOB|nr:MurR/RpiR family transcriptional regulator [Pseudogemmobacter faecipullorum]MCB5410732.1 MurR/RpiR family transcriptional regulator [Pseudogemmobacter faecipullorum]